MKEYTTLDRRSYLKQTAAGVVGSAALATTTASAAQTKIEVTENDGERVDYRIEINDNSMQGGSDLDSGDTVGSDYCEGWARGGTDTYYMSDTAELDRVTISNGSAASSCCDGTLSIYLTGGLESYQDGDLDLNGLESGGSFDLKYNFKSTGSVSAEGDLESDDSVYSGSGDTNDTASGSLDEGGTDRYNMEGQFDWLEGSPRGGKLEYQRII
jgi:hypothetical protein